MQARYRKLAYVHQNYPKQGNFLVLIGEICGVLPKERRGKEKRGELLMIICKALLDNIKPYLTMFSLAKLISLD